MTPYELAYYYMQGIRHGKTTSTADAFYDTAVWDRPFEQYSTDRLAMVALFLQDLIAGYHDEGLFPDAPHPLLSEPALEQLKAYQSKLEAHLKKA